jgi:hypothetical protein
VNELTTSPLTVTAVRDFRLAPTDVELIYQCATGICVYAVKNPSDLAGHVYVYTGIDTRPKNREGVEIELSGKGVQFQMGNPAEHGLNGPTMECMLAIMIHRTKYLNAKFHSGHNTAAILAMDDALAQLEARTRERSDRNVVGQDVQ